MTTISIDYERRDVQTVQVGRPGVASPAVTRAAARIRRGAKARGLSVHINTTGSGATLLVRVIEPKG